MKKWIIALIILAFCSGVKADPNDGLALTFMSQQNESAFNARISYVTGMFEPFMGSEIRLDSDPEVFDVGCLIHSKDVVEPNAVALISPLLTKIFNSDMVLKGYTGFHSTININNKGSYFGSIIGISLKDKPSSKFEIVGEVHMNDIGGKSELDNYNITETAFFVGIKWRF